MKELRILGLRSLVDSTAIRIAPITVLLGENSAGKSTFLRTFPLLRQTSEVRTSEPLLWYGRLVDFGSFEESLSKFKKDRSIELELLLNIDTNFSFSQRRINSRTKIADHLCRARFTIAEDESNNKSTDAPKTPSYLKSLTLEICDTQIIFDFNSKPQITKLQIDSFDLTTAANSSFSIGESRSLSPMIFSKQHLIGDLKSEGEGESIEVKLFSFLKKLVHGKTKEESIADLAYSMELGAANNMLTAIQAAHTDRGLWKKDVLGWTVSSPEFIALKQLIWASRLEDILDSLSQSLRDDCTSISYITPLRAAAERYYRQQGLATNELDAKGENFALFLKSLHKVDRDSLKKWLSNSLGVFVESDETRGHVSLYLADGKSQARVNLADTGFGYSQLLPIAVQLWIAQSSARNRGRSLNSRGSGRLIVIEQPELHLHPRIQAKVADLMAHTVSSNQKIRSRLIIETHSEALVNRLGKLVANGTLLPSDVNIVLFNKPKFSEPTVVSATSFDENGFLQDWPLGFFNSD